ncbi:MAG: ComEA family DNA-binding protein [Candidatus Riflebacteria bacterium]|nr:ComEA family DNA-binding protein [Candidatus Riflebacteria bacterium]
MVLKTFATYEKLILVSAVVLTLSLIILNFQYRSHSKTEKLIETEIKKISALYAEKPLKKGFQLQFPDNNKLLNLNSATIDQIVQLPGVGKKTAEKIIALRNELGKFSDISQLLLIKTITEKKLDSISQFAGTFSFNSENVPEKLNLNDANQDELSQLPAIGKKLAQRIIDSRENKGRFFSIDELLEIQGITENTLEKISDLIEVK